MFIQDNHENISKPWIYICGRNFIFHRYLMKQPKFRFSQLLALKTKRNQKAVAMRKIRNLFTFFPMS